MVDASSSHNNLPPPSAITNYPTIPDSATSIHLPNRKHIEEELRKLKAKLSALQAKLPKRCFQRELYKLQDELNKPDINWSYFRLRRVQDELNCIEKSLTTVIEKMQPPAATQVAAGAEAISLEHDDFVDFIFPTLWLSSPNILIMVAETCSDLYRAVGEDFWLATWCNSTSFEGGERGFDFAIRTPCTPSRWEDFDAEMAMAWDAVCNTYCGENYGSTDFDVLENLRGAILRMTYYWYNFMPLSRGSAAVGFVVLQGLLLAANMEFTGQIPKDLQVDWEAILNSDPNSFVESVKSWLYPSLKVMTSWKDYPEIAATFETTGSIVAALSAYND
ncbi:Suppressor of RPS4-RLD 1 [Linum grandiflorum]